MFNVDLGISKIENRKKKTYNNYNRSVGPEDLAVGT
jgi:hypothetical protein